MRKFKFLWYILILILLPNSVFSETQPYKWQIGEELVYKVKWSFIRLGTLKLVVEDTLHLDEQFVYHVRLYIDSNPLLFFVNMHSVYDSYIDDLFRIHLFTADEKIDNVTYKAEYLFNYADSIIHVDMASVEDPGKKIIKDLPLTEKIMDGTTMIFYARQNAAFARTDTVTSFFEAKKGKVAINFKGKKGDIKIDALNTSLKTYYVDGMVRMKGIAGLSGPYKGWFAMDSQRPPLKAELKVFIGHVSVELEDWKKWTPVFYSP